MLSKGVLILMHVGRASHIKHLKHSLSMFFFQKNLWLNSQFPIWFPFLRGPWFFLQLPFSLPGYQVTVTIEVTTAATATSQPLVLWEVRLLHIKQLALETWRITQVIGGSSKSVPIFCNWDGCHFNVGSIWVIFRCQFVKRPCNVWKSYQKKISHVCEVFYQINKPF